MTSEGVGLEVLFRGVVVSVVCVPERGVPPWDPLWYDLTRWDVVVAVPPGRNVRLRVDHKQARKLKVGDPIELNLRKVIP